MYHLTTKVSSFTCVNHCWLNIATSWWLKSLKSANFILGTLKCSQNANCGLTPPMTMEWNRPVYEDGIEFSETAYNEFLPETRTTTEIHLANYSHHKLVGSLCLTESQPLQGVISSLPSVWWGKGT